MLGAVLRETHLTSEMYKYGMLLFVIYDILLKKNSLKTGFVMAAYFWSVVMEKKQVSFCDLIIRDYKEDNYTITKSAPCFGLDVIRHKVIDTKACKRLN